MVYEFRLPDVGEGIAEGEVVKWLVKEGDYVKENQPLVEIMTDKVNVEIPSPKRGTVLRLMAKEGEVIKVGQVLLSIEEEGTQSLIQPVQTPRPAPPVPTIPTPTTKHLDSTISAQTKSHDILAAPATRRLARELGVDLSRLQGTGPGGRITDQDVQNHKNSEANVAPMLISTDTQRAPEERVSLRGIRRKIAERMVKSKQTAPHVTHVEEVDMTEIVQLREEAKRSGEKSGIKLTYLPFIIKALIPALKQYPFLNSTLDDDKQEIIIKHYYNIGIATDTEQGLVVPVLRDTEHKSIAQLAEEIAKLSEAARAGQLNLNDVQGSTFTITNVGSIGGIFATPIINYPEVAILGVHKITKRAVVKNNQIVIRDMTYLSLSFDHRVLDGAMAARFVAAIKQYLEDPKLLLLQTD